MKRAFAAGLIIVVFALCGCARQQYTTLEEAVRAGAKIEKGITIDGADVSDMDIVAARRLINEANENRVRGMIYTISLAGKSVQVKGSGLNISFNTDDVLLQAANMGAAGLFSTESRALTTQADASVRDIERGIRAAAAELKREAKDAKVSLASGGEFAIAADEAGQEVNTAKLAEEIREYVRRGEGGAIAAPYSMIYPEYTVEQARNDTQLIAEFTTYFKGSTYGKENRVRNIVKASGLIDKCVIDPGDIFSINQVLGERNEKNGWSVAAGIKDGAYVQEYGGGVCQVSTTLYNALLMADMHIVERHHHSWPLGYVDIGRDATISTGGPDLRFENTSGAALFIRSETDEKQKRITVKLYGRPLADGVSIELSSKKVKTLDDLGTEVEEDASLKPGEQQIVRKARQGSVAITYKTYYSAEGAKLGTQEVTRDTYRSIKGLIKIAPAAAATGAEGGE